MNTKHWGEIPNSNSEILPDISEDIEKAMNKFCLSEFDSKDETESTANHHIVFPPEDPLVMYAISLHQYMNHLTEITRLGELAVETNLRPPKDVAPPTPPLPDICEKYRRNCSYFMPKKETDFTLGKNVEIPILNEQIIGKMLKRSICILLAQIGYESTYESILNILVDVLREFYIKMCSKIKIAVNDENEHGSSGFPNVMDKVLVDLGSGGVKGIHDYYQARVVKYINVLLNRSKELNENYRKLVSSKAPSPVDDLNKIMSVKIEKEEIEENPEVHLLDGEIELSSLETGFQLLNSLEAETNMQNLEGEEDILPNESSGNINSELEYSPFIKKKKSNAS